ncbi:MAG: DUF4468 domain-containing protein [Flavisolibacter sp.]
MKYLLLLMSFLPMMVWGQTVHIKKGKIVYKGTVKNINYERSELYKRAKKALASHVKDTVKSFYIDDMGKGEMAIKGEMKLNAPPGFAKTVFYNFKLKIRDSSYKYRIDKVYIKQEGKGEKNNLIASETLVKDMNVSGNVAINAEKELNEIDMNFQKLISQIKHAINKPAMTKS